MKRCVAVIAVAAVLAAPPAAQASIRHFDGSVDTAGAVSFDAKKRLGRVVQVLAGFAFSHVPVSCDDGHHHIKGSFDFRMDVYRRRFEGTGSYHGQGNVTVSGKFSRAGRRAHGTIQVSGDFTEIGATGCHAEHDWTAHKT